MQLKKELEEKLDNIVKELTDERVDLQVDVPEDIKKGDFTSNIALTLFSTIKNHGSGFKSPLELAEKIVDLLNIKYQTQNPFRLIEAKNPGFINFWLSNEEIEKCTHKANSGYENKSEEGSLIFEFGDPNPFKEPHIGHLRNLVLGETISRLQEFEGVKVIRTNYQGDVGMHVAKCLWGILQKSEIQDQILNDEGTLEEKAKSLGEAYQKGAKAFEEDSPLHEATGEHRESAKEEIVSINNKIYTSVNSKGKSASSENGEKLYEIWEKGRRVSLDYFEELYQKLGIKYEKYYLSQR
jgi:arginyl-tRNA synthetase